MEEVIYSNHTIDFVKIAVEFCGWAENVRKIDKDTFIDQGVKILPMLYLKASFVPLIEEEYDSDLEVGVVEEMYARVQNGVADLLGDDDLYLETFHPEMQYSDTPIAVNISEDLADIYQDLGNFISVFKHGQKETMNDSLAACIEAFKEYWGQKLVNVLRALHYLKYKEVENGELNN
ncbi:MAG: DUF5063 domain-containing protein [Candidatus Azobacteroides sp.]|nr:DUF5063 domain-containing protein [Candidatus Azobacteroides sp.]